MSALMSLVLLVTSLTPPRLADIPAACAPATEQSRWIATWYANSAERAEERAHDGVPTISADQMRALEPGRDEEMCRRLSDAVVRTVAAYGGHLDGLVPVYFEGGGYYFAVMTRAERPRPPTPPGAVHVDTRWILLLVFDREMRHVASAAM